MEIYAGVFAPEGDVIPLKKKKEFAERVEKIFQAGGMMEVEWIQLYGKEVPIISIASMKESGMEFCYNYFEDDYWENAGFNLKGGYIWSKNIGVSEFYRAVVAAYVLEELYTDGIAITTVNYKYVASWIYVGWINYLFNEKYHVKNTEPWKLLEEMHYLEYEEDDMDWQHLDHILPISTADFFKQNPDDMIPYWKEGEFDFSIELLDWFRLLREQYDKLFEEEIFVENTLKYMMDLLEDANNNYYQIHAFSNFFYETLENQQDKRYQTLWRLFDNMIHNQEMKEAGDVIFVPDGSGHENERMSYIGRQPCRRLRGIWSSMDSAKKMNKARVTFRRYMALVGNPDLRRKVFGF